MILSRDFYNIDARDLSRKLLGKIMVREVDGKVLKARIVETEAYIGAIDKASHAYNNRRTARTEIMYEEGGHAYVYLIYGLYHCVNATADRKDYAAASLIRGVEPLNEFDYIAQKRFHKNYNELTKAQIKNLTNGPSKLCMALSITKEQNKCELFNKKGGFYIEDSDYTDFEIVETTRIGIDYAEEAIDYPWRYYIKGNNFVSKK